MTTTDARDASAGATPREMSDDTAMDASSASVTRDEIVMDDALGSATAMPKPGGLSPGGSRKKFDGPTWTRVAESKLDASVGVAHEMSIERV